jgi:hypothetical protein
MISTELRARIRRLFFAEHWKIGTIGGGRAAFSFPKKSEFFLASSNGRLLAWSAPFTITQSGAKSRHDFVRPVWLRRVPARRPR